MPIKEIYVLMGLMNKLLICIMALMSSCSFPAKSMLERCEEYCAEQGKDCLGIRATPTKARAQVLGRSGELVLDREGHRYRCGGQ